MVTGWNSPLGIGNCIAGTANKSWLFAESKISCTVLAFSVGYGESESSETTIICSMANAIFSFRLLIHLNKTVLCYGHNHLYGISETYT